MAKTKLQPILDISPNQVEVLTYDQIIKINEMSNTPIVNPSIQGGTLTTGSGDNVFKSNPRYGIWLGNANFVDAPFSVSMTGSLIASDITITGGTLKYGKTAFTDFTNAGYYISSLGVHFGQSATSYLKYTIGGALELVGSTISTSIITSIQAGSEISIQGWQHDMTFTADSNVQVSWASGTITLLDGTTYAIDAGNTGAISAITYIYLDIATSTTVLQTCVDADAPIIVPVGTGKILVAVAQNVATGNSAIFQVFGGKALGGLGKLIVASNIAADTITANEIYANTITAAEIAANTITAAEIAANTITATEINTGSINIGDWAGNLDDIDDDGTYKKVVANEKTGAGRAYLGLDSDNRIAVGFYDTSLSSLSLPTNGIRIDSNGIYGRKSGSTTFYIDTTGSAYFSGELLSTSGKLGAWTLATNKLTSYGGNIELQAGDVSTEPHIKAIYDTDNYIQMTAESNVPRLDIIYAGHMRTSLREQKLNFYNASDTLGCSIYGDTVSAQSGLILNGNFAALEAKASASMPLYLSTTSYFGTIVMDQSTGFLSIQADSTAQRVEIYGNLVAQTGGTWDIGHSTRQWKDLYLTGAAYIDAFAEDILPNVNGSLDLGASATAWQDVHIKGGLNMYNSSTTTQRVLHVTSSNTANLYCDKHFIPVGGGSECTLTVGSDGEYWNNVYSDAFTEKSPKYLTNVGLAIINKVKSHPETGKIDSRKGKLPKELSGPEESGFELGKGIMACFDAIKQLEIRLKKVEGV